MAYSGEVIINTKIDNRGIIVGVRDAAKRIGALTDEFKKTSAAIEVQTDKIRKMQRTYEMVSAEAKEGNKQATKYMGELSGEIKSAQKDLTTLTDKTKNLSGALSRISEKGVLDFSGQAKQAQEDIKAFEDSLKRLNDQLSKEQDPATLKALQYEIAATEQGFQKFKDNISQPVSDIMAIQQVGQEIRNINDEIQRLTSDISMSQNPIEKMQLFVSLERAQNQAKTLQEELETLKDAEVDISVDGAEEVKASLENIGAAAEKAAQISTGAFKELGSFIGGIAAGATRAARNIIGVAKNILTLGSSSNKASGGVNGLFKRLLQLGAAAFVFNVLRKGLRELSDSIRGLLMANQEFASAWNNIRVNMISAFAPLWEVLEPAIVRFMQLLAQFTAVLAQFMALLFGKTYTQARASAKALNDQSKALKGVGAAADKAGGQLASFDEIQKQSAETAGGGGGAGAIDFPEPDLSWLDSLEGFDFGRSIADSIIKALNSIPWGKIQSAAGVLAKNLADFLNGALVYPALWQAIGYTVAQGLNTALIFASTFIENFQWGKFGSAIADGINKFFDTFDWGLLGRTISGFALGLLDFLSNAIRRVNWKQLGESIREVLKNIDWNGIAKAVYDVVAGAFSAVYDFFIGLLGKPLVDTLISSAAAIAAFAGSIAVLLGAIKIIAIITQLASAFATLGLSLGAVFGGAALVAVGAGIAAFVSLSDMAAGWAIALSVISGALVAFGIALMAGFGPVGWVVGAIAGLVTAFVSLSKHFGWFNEVIPQIQRFGDEISNATKNMLNPIIDGADEARNKLRSVFEESKPIVASDAIEIAGYFTEMANTAIYELERQKNAALQWAAEAFGEEAANYEARLAVVNRTYDAMIADIERHAASLDSAALQAKATFGTESDEYKKAQAEYEVYANTIEAETAKINVARDDELTKTLENFGEQAAAWEEQKQTISQNYDEQIGTIQTKTDEQREIIAKALAEGETLTEESYNTLLGTVEDGLSNIQDVLVTDADERQSLAETRNEDLINEQKRHVAELLQEYAGDREEAIKAAKEKYNELETEARRMYHNGEITREAYQEMKLAYSADKEDAIAVAKEKYDGMMQETTSGMTDLGNELDLQTGKIKSKWSLFWENLWGGVKNFFSGNKKEIADDWGGAVTDAIDAGNKAADINSPSKKTADTGKNMKDGLLLGMDGLAAAVSSIFQNALNGIQKIWGEAFKWFETNVIEPIKKAFDAALKAIYEFFSKVWTDIKTIWNVASGWFETNVTKPIRDAFDKAIKDITGFFNGLWKTVSDIFGKIGDLISNVLDKIGDVISGAGSASKAASSVRASSTSSRSIDISPSLFTPAIGNIEIPKLARGGIVDSATIAMIGEKGREAVVPLSHNAEWMEPFKEMQSEMRALRDAFEDAARHGFSGGQATVILEIDRHEFGRATVEFGDKERERMGMRIQPRFSY